MVRVHKTGPQRMSKLLHQPSRAGHLFPLECSTLSPPCSVIAGLLLFLWVLSQKNTLLSSAFIPKTIRHEAKAPCFSKRIRHMHDIYEEVLFIFNLTNTLRNRIALGDGFLRNIQAANMRTLHWDDGLAECAQRWADRCEMKAYNNSASHPGLEYGQTFGELLIPRNTSPYTSLQTIFMNWFNEYRDFNATQVEDFESSEKTGNFTQLIWANTLHIGCGRVEIRLDNTTKKTRLFCNYFPKGNVKGKPVFIPGPARSACAYASSEEDNQYPGLCGMILSGWLDEYGNYVMCYILSVFAVFAFIRIVVLIIQVRGAARRRTQRVSLQLQEHASNGFSEHHL